MSVDKHSCLWWQLSARVVKALSLSAVFLVAVACLTLLSVLSPASEPVHQAQVHMQARELLNTSLPWNHLVPSTYDWSNVPVSAMTPAL